MLCLWLEICSALLLITDYFFTQVARAVEAAPVTVAVVVLSDSPINDSELQELNCAGTVKETRMCVCNSR